MNPHATPDVPADPGAPARRKATTGAEPSPDDPRAPLVPATAPSPRFSNVRRTTHALQLFTLMLVIMVLAFAACLSGLYSFYQKNIEPYLSKSPPVPVAVPVTSPGDVDADKKPGVPPEYRDALNAATSKIEELQKQIDALRVENKTAELRVSELSEKVNEKPSALAPTPAVDTGEESAARVAALVPNTSQSNQELVLLKERNRLTSFADQAIAEGKRESLDRLLEAMSDKDLAKLHHAAYAEIQRVYYHLRYMNRIEPGYALPVNEMYKDPAIRSETDLSTDQVIALLKDQGKEWKMRLRAAYLLGGRRTPEVGDALLKALKEDPVLDVAKEAQFSFEQNTNRTFLLFDIGAIESWWAEQKNMNSDPLPKQKATAKDAKKK